MCITVRCAFMCRVAQVDAVMTVIISFPRHPPRILPIICLQTFYVYNMHTFSHIVCKERISFQKFRSEDIRKDHIRQVFIDFFYIASLFQIYIKIVVI